MDPQQIERARQAKRMYLLALLFNVIVGGALRFSSDNFINAIVSPFIFILQLIVLLRMYAKRTGVRLTFLMGDRMPGVPAKS